jgi:hypothetical protein
MDPGAQLAQAQEITAARESPPEDFFKKLEGVLETVRQVRGAFAGFLGWAELLFCVGCFAGGSSCASGQGQAIDAA